MKKRAPLPSAFSLVEVALAIGLVAFGFVALLGVVPVGLNSSQKAMHSGLQSQILQEICSEIQLSQFKEFNEPDFAARFPKYYDDQGRQIDSTNPALSHSLILISRRPPILPGADEPNSDMLTLEFAIETRGASKSARHFCVTVARKDT